MFNIIFFNLLSFTLAGHFGIPLIERIICSGAVVAITRQISVTHPLTGALFGGTMTWVCSDIDRLTGQRPVPVSPPVYVLPVNIHWPDGSIDVNMCQLTDFQSVLEKKSIVYDATVYSSQSMQVISAPLKTEIKTTPKKDNEREFIQEVLNNLHRRDYQDQDETLCFKADSEDVCIPRSTLDRIESKLENSQCNSEREGTMMCVDDQLFVVCVADKWRANKRCGSNLKCTEGSGLIKCL